jgi:hypothetical protein
METTMNSVFRSRWWIPGFSLFLGVLILGASWIGGSLATGLGGFAVMAGVGVATFLFGSHSETISGLSGPGRDERWAMIDIAATAAAGLFLLTVLVGAWLYEIARGGDGNPYGWLLGVSGVAYLVAVFVLRARR